MRVAIARASSTSARVILEYEVSSDPRVRGLEGLSGKKASCVYACTAIVQIVDIAIASLQPTVFIIVSV